MNDWKIGDKVYYFWHADDCSLVWDFKNFIIEEDEVVDFNSYGEPKFGGHYSFDAQDSFFKSKNEAIDAMIKYLEGLRDGENL